VIRMAITVVKENFAGNSILILAIYNHFDARRKVINLSAAFRR
jgi:hypothetical protein